MKTTRILMAALLTAGTLSAEQNSPAPASTEPLAPQMTATLTSDAPALEETPATNEDSVAWPSGVFADLSVGTQGLGMDVGYSFNRHFKLRARGTFLTYERDDNWDEVNVTCKLKNYSCGLIFDYHPFGESFRLSVGINASPLKVQADGTMDGSDQFNGEYTLGDYDYKVDGVGKVRGEYKWNTVQPYIGIGWSCSSQSEHAWFFTADLGVNFIGNGKLRVNSSGDIQQKKVGEPHSAYHPVDNSLLETSLREEGKDFFKIADKIVVYPVVHIGVGCRF